MYLFDNNIRETVVIAPRVYNKLAILMGRGTVATTKYYYARYSLYYYEFLRA